ncbi:hypothetical protein GF373_04030, partial [bacterium]|nr:hypothetical protein [bacterium]
RLFQSMLEEKTSRTVEILLSSLSPMELFSGKVFGLYIISLVQLAIWVGCTMLLLPFMDISVMDYISISYFLHYLAYLSTGFLTYAALFALLGNMVGSEVESQPYQVVLSLSCILPMMVNIVIIQQPNWWPVVALSFFPLFTPTLMALRLSVTTIPWWESAALLSVSLLCGMFFIWAAARVFRVSVLMTGKQFSIKEILYWSFYQERQGIAEGVK